VHGAEVAAGIEVRPRVGMQTMDPVVKIELSGITRPRTVTYLGTDGTHHRVVHKGPKEDMRQDRMVTQLLRVFNVLLAADPHAKARGLRMREH